MEQAWQHAIDQLGKDITIRGCNAFCRQFNNYLRQTVADPPHPPVRYHDIHARMHTLIRNSPRVPTPLVRPADKLAFARLVERSLPALLFGGGDVAEALAGAAVAFAALQPMNGEQLLLMLRRVYKECAKQQAAEAEAAAEAMRRAEAEAEAVRRAGAETEAVRRAEAETEAVRRAGAETEAVRRAEAAEAASRATADGLRGEVKALQAAVSRQTAALAEERLERLAGEERQKAQLERQGGQQQAALGEQEMRQQVALGEERAERRAGEARQQGQLERQRAQLEEQQAQLEEQQAQLEEQQTALREEEAARVAGEAKQQAQLEEQQTALREEQAARVAGEAKQQAQLEEQQTALREEQAARVAGEAKQLAALQAEKEARQAAITQTNMTFEQVMQRHAYDDARRRRPFRGNLNLCFAAGTDPLDIADLLFSAAPYGETHDAMEARIPGANQTLFDCVCAGPAGLLRQLDRIQGPWTMLLMGASGVGKTAAAEAIRLHITGRHGADAGVTHTATEIGTDGREVAVGTHRTADTLANPHSSRCVTVHVYAFAAGHRAVVLDFPGDESSVCRGKGKAKAADARLLPAGAAGPANSGSSTATATTTATTTGHSSDQLMKQITSFRTDLGHYFTTGPKTHAVTNATGWARTCLRYLPARRSEVGLTCFATLDNPQLLRPYGELVEIIMGRAGPGLVTVKSK
ncbi:hypothetical protein DFH27DRAFT_602675 [Peziza echinospora]|nr:hypothetical protein DFH27DRAFT_602675 [Peziza echinospora]